MKLTVPNLGELEIPEEEILSFSKGPLAFEAFTKFAIINAEEQDFPFKLLQSLEEGSLAFIIADPFLFNPEYDFELGEDILQELEIETPEQILVYVVLVIPEKVEDISANFAAPLIINTGNKKAKQVILEGKEYQTRQKIFSELAKTKVQKEVANVNP